MDAKKSNSNKIRDIVRLQQLLKKWKKHARNNNNNNNNSNNSSNNGSSTGNKQGAIKFLKKTLSFSDNSVSSATTTTDYVPKGYLAVCVGKELKRYVIPTDYLGHQAFGILLREAEEEFGFQQEGVLKIPCDEAVFERILKMVEDKRENIFLHDLGIVHDFDVLSSSLSGCCSPDYHDQLLQSSHPQLCR